MRQNEEILKEIFCELLAEKEIALTDSPRDIGLDSLQMVILVAKIEVVFDIEIPDEYLSIESFSTVGNILEMINYLTQKKLEG